jgi:serine protease Do
MTLSVRTGLMGLLFLTSPLAACAQQDAASAAPAAAASALPSIAQSSAPQIVTGLPDFTRLVEQVGPGVVNIEATTSNRQAAQGQRQTPPEMEGMPEFFRRFFGPDFQMPPGQPGPGQRMPGASRGSGFIISPDGYVLTNHHVVTGADRVTVTLSDRRELEAKVVGSDQQYDVALLKIEASDLPSIRLGSSSTLKPGQWVVAIGSPFGFDNSVTAGIVSATGRANQFAEQRYVPFIQTDVAINQGNSGGPLLNTSGEVVGINSQIFSASGGYMGISFAIPIDLAMNAAEQIKKTGRVSRGQLGVIVGQITSDIAQGFNLPDTRGALVNQVLPDSAAAKAGIEVGDVIRSVNGTPINESSGLPPLIGGMAPGSRVKLDILREGRQREVTVTLTRLEEDTVATGTPAPEAGPATPAAPSHSAMLGIGVSELDAATRRQLGLEASEGVRIAAVSGQQAREAGLSQGLIVLQVGRTKVGSVSQFNQALAAVKPGDVVMLLVRSPSNGATRFAPVTAGDAK